MNDFIGLMQSHTQPISRKCQIATQQITALNESRRYSESVKDVIEVLLEVIFTPEKGWMYTNDEADKNALVMFLNPNCPFFTLLYWVSLQDTIFFISSIHMPRIVERVLRNGGELHRLYKYNKQEDRIEFNALNYFVALFAWSISEMTQYIPAPNSCYNLTFQMYLDYFLPVQGDTHTHVSYNFLENEFPDYFLRLILDFWMGKNDFNLEKYRYKSPNTQLVTLVKLLVIHILKRFHPSITHNPKNIFRDPYFLTLRPPLYLFITLSLRVAINATIPIYEIVQLWELFMAPWLFEIDFQVAQRQPNLFNSIKKTLLRTPERRERSLEEMLGNEFLTIYAEQNFPFYLPIFLDYLRLCGTNTRHLKTDSHNFEWLINFFGDGKSQIVHTLKNLDVLCKNNKNGLESKKFEMITGTPYPNVFKEDIKGYLSRLYSSLHELVSENQYRENIIDALKSLFNISEIHSAPEYYHNQNNAKIDQRSMTPYPVKHVRKLRTINFKGEEHRKPISSYEIGLLVRLTNLLSSLLESQTGARINLRVMADKGNLFFTGTLILILGIVFYSLDIPILNLLSSMFIYLGTIITIIILLIHFFSIGSSRK